MFTVDVKQQYNNNISKNVVWTHFPFLFTSQLLLSQTSDISKFLRGFRNLALSSPLRHQELTVIKKKCSVAFKVVV